MDIEDKTLIDPVVFRDCKSLFTIIDPEAFDFRTGDFKEVRCRACQCAYRIAAANEMHRTGVFVCYAKASRRRLPGMW